MSENRISRRANAVGRTKIRMMYELEAQYENVISFTVGEPDFPTPDNIVRACKASLDAHQTFYAPNQGVYALREAVARRIRLTHGVRYTPEEILITAGGMDALRMAAEALIDPGDEVLIPNPYWANHHHHPLLELGVPIPVPVAEKCNFMYDPDELERYVTPRTKMIVLNSPSNPTGRVMDWKTMERLCAFVKQYDLILISDEVYEHLIYDGVEFCSPLMFAGMKERTVLCSSLSKTYAMTGWRLGYACGPEDIISAMLRMNENTIASPTTFVQYAAIEALDGPQDAKKHMVEAFHQRRDLICRELNAIDGIRCSVPQGAFYVFADIRGTGLSSEKFSARLLREQQVSVTPGNGFGSGGEGYVRMSYALSTEKILEGIKRIRRFVQSLKRPEQGEKRGK